MSTKVNPAPPPCQCQWRHKLDLDHGPLNPPSHLLCHFAVFTKNFGAWWPDPLLQKRVRAGGGGGIQTSPCQKGKKNYFWQWKRLTIFGPWQAGWGHQGGRGEQPPPEPAAHPMNTGAGCHGCGNPQGCLTLCVPQRRGGLQGAMYGCSDGTSATAPRHAARRWHSQAGRGAATRPPAIAHIGPGPGVTVQCLTASPPLSQKPLRYFPTLPLCGGGGEGALPGKGRNSRQKKPDKILRARKSHFVRK